MDVWSSSGVVPLLLSQGQASGALGSNPCQVSPWFCSLKQPAHTLWASVILALKVMTIILNWVEFL